MTRYGHQRQSDRLRVLLTALAVLLTLCAAPFAQASQVIESVRLHRAPDHTRIVFDLKEPVEHRVDRLGNPERLVIDLDDTQLDFNMNSLDLSGGPISGVRVGRHANDMTRVVLDLNSAVRPRTNLLKPIEPHGWRLVVDLFDSEPEPVRSMEQIVEQQAGPRSMIVAIDAGHGGEDPGAIGPSGVYEKTIVLQIAKRLERLLKDAPGIEPVMIRDGDYYVPLAERRRIAAEQHGADVFISLHADAFTDSRAHGASVFALSNHGATSARAGYLARMANDSDRVAGVYEEEKDNNGLLGVLADMTMSGSMAHSLFMGREMLDELGGITKLHGDRRTVEQANFAVLREPSMVSVLVETGFISNREEERKLRSAEHQEKVARAILNGVRRYFEHHPAPGSWFAEQRRRGGSSVASHRIQPGETLSAIARRYSVSEDALRSANSLNGDLIRVGQVLTIPGT
ncbi:N-acetylmuramoyl-L-alanine amidase domain-containing protein [Isoalcanivorax pacificus W11-5]|uniref:N-acetylmuramoyl-L-alanine amidase n=1 Tax=Isoalcanivorax pacificus W11-5 TaxID=391936 RepID=A0A0B4XQV4_9GAMM|nr:N-acetylmuramoyl-L-alanine amidase [Isoalcanivorax pacificus]AJD49566.1 N-acetylmuramoyl-L-alanine amidase domain-containing protein [Isoalcanivorax pacificus W11-5]